MLRRVNHDVKIIRINGDRTVRIMYNGTEEQFDSTGKMNSVGIETQINSETYVWNTTNHDDAKYVGYMYGGENGLASTSRNGIISTAATYNETNSNAKLQLDIWYQTNMLGKSFENKISDNLFCNDRQLSSEVGGQATGPGFRTSSSGFTYYAGYHHVNTNKTPTLKCGLQNDRFTVSDTTIGNGALTYPIGLITVDETSMGGLMDSTPTTVNYLWSSSSYLTFSPAFMHSSGFARMFNVNSNGPLSYSDITVAYGLRAVLNLNSDIQVTGEGTATNPYRI